MLGSVNANLPEIYTVGTMKPITYDPVKPIAATISLRVRGVIKKRHDIAIISHIIQIAIILAFFVIPLLARKFEIYDPIILFETSF